MTPARLGELITRFRFFNGWLSLKERDDTLAALERLKALEAIHEPRSPVGTNTGHGHAWERPDGMRARCGGPGMCPVCSRDKALLEQLGAKP